MYAVIDIDAVDKADRLLFEYGGAEDRSREGEVEHPITHVV